jgi:tetratricopeptide (TPR) repeat protein
VLFEDKNDNYVKYYEKYLKLGGNVDDESYIYIIRRLADYYYRAGEHFKAFKYYGKCLKVNDKLPLDEKAEINNKMGMMRLLYAYKDSMVYFREAEKLYEEFKTGQGNNKKFNPYSSILKDTKKIFSQSMNGVVMADRQGLLPSDRINKSTWFIGKQWVDCETYPPNY